MITIEIFWLSDSTFLIKTNLGRKILIDPFNPRGPSNQYISADIITYSKTFNNSNFNIINSHCKIINTPEVFRDDSILIKGYSTFSDKYNGLKRGNNIIYLFEVDNYNFCHLGYLGHLINNEMINLLKNIDFLFVPIGGNLSLNGDDAFKLCKELSPKFIIPMCYKDDKNNFYFDNPKSFLSNFKEIQIINNQYIDTTKLPNDCHEVVLFTKKKRVV